MQAKEYRFSIAPFKAQVDRLRSEMLRALRSKEPYDIRRFFFILPLNPEHADTEERFAARGSISHAGSQQLRNVGAQIDAVFNDDALGRIAIFVPSRLAATYRVTRDSFEVSFQGSKPIVTLYDLPLSAGLDKRFSCSGVSFGPREVVWSLTALVEPATALTLRCDLDHVALARIAAAGPAFTAIAAILQTGDGPCGRGVGVEAVPCEEVPDRERKWAVLCTDPHGVAGGYYETDLSECEANQRAKRHKSGYNSGHDAHVFLER